MSKNTGLQVAELSCVLRYRRFWHHCGR